MAMIRNSCWLSSCHVRVCPKVQRCEDSRDDGYGSDCDMGNDWKMILCRRKDESVTSNCSLARIQSTSTKQLTVMIMSDQLPRFVKAKQFWHLSA
mmetsp:Transcript_1034/g.2245  ORF Transcript_1034/g.2245 Transcript_1034/m.2245 type:complete len:95 (+) Transcript_1034:1170-1454(+)